MAKKLTDTTPRFDRLKHYAIGTLKADSSPSEVPERFASTPVKPVYITGMEMLSAGMLTCRDYLTSLNCHFKQNAPVYFYEVDYLEDNKQSFKLIYTGTPSQKSEQLTMSDGATQVNSIFPVYSNGESEKLLFQTQSEQISYYQQCLQDERKQFNSERIGYISKIQEYSDKLVEKEIEVNKLSAENEALKIRYEEANRYMERISQMGRGVDEESQPSLADKGISLLDGMLGEGTSQLLVGQLVGGLGQGVSKGIEFLVDLARQKKGIPKEQSPVQSPSPIWNQAPVNPQAQQNVPINTDGDLQWQG